MSRFIDKEAKETAGLSSDSDSLFSDEGSDLSENELSDAIPLQNLANSSRAEKENQTRPATEKAKHKKARKQRRTEILASDHEATKETNRLVKKLFSKMKCQESRLKAIEEKLKEATSSSSCVTPSPKRAVKREVPVEVRVSLDS